MEEITAIFLCERQRWDDTIIADAELDGAPAASQEVSTSNGESHNGDGSLAPRCFQAAMQKTFAARNENCVTLKGQAPLDGPDALASGLAYRFYGKYVEHAKYGRQFVFQTYILCQPHGEAGTIRYLQTAPHVGLLTARALWIKFQSQAVRILREQPDVAAAAINGAHFGVERATAAANYLREQEALESCSIDLIDLLGGRGFPRSTARKAIRVWGNKAADVIRINPYVLMRFRGCGFLTTDKMYLDLGLPPAKLKRQAYAAAYELASDTQGHTWHAVQKAEAGILARISGASATPVAAIKLAKRGKLIATHRDAQDRLWVAQYAKAAAEQIVAAKVARMLLDHRQPDEASGIQWPAADEIDGLSEHQAEQFARATTARIGVFGGSPGTGKTYTVAAAARLIVERFGTESIAIAAPTGKAAVRCTEAMAAYGLPLRATTIHRLLKVGEADSNEGWGFKHDEYCPLMRQFVVIDESSMIDTGLMASLLKAIARGTHLLFVGDVNQLPPVGHGAPLRDLIAAKVPYGELREIRRNSGTIVRACAQIRDGQRFATVGAIDLTTTPAKNLRLIGAADEPTQRTKMLGVLSVAAGQGRDPIWDCQVICATNKAGPLSRRQLNQLLQQTLNKTGEKAGSNPFLVGDKIVNTKNGFFPLDYEYAERLKPPLAMERTEDGKTFAANGELARVLAVSESLTVAELSSPRRIIKIPRDTNCESANEKDSRKGQEDENKTNTGCQWDLGFALSCHKSQGSEFPVVIVMLDAGAGARWVCSREWIYTAISRAKELCLLIGKKATADGYCARIALHKRKTLLAERIEGELAGQEKLLSERLGGAALALANAESEQ